ncbi:MAG: glycosyltransferase, partial [Anaerolineae bacterium]|nr:glycosyltransferase [Anaerolineae bacterium]NIN95255.1 glycosyltransferase [Anaerolineae bacterium]NIQ78220.1 glycosyltransferase [Anaerolineae bacterium]
IPETYSGIETALKALCPRLVQRGHEVSVYCRSYYGLPDEYEGVRLISLPSINTKHLDTITHVFLCTLHSLVQDFDILHFHALGPTLLSWLPRAEGRKVVATVQGLDWQRAKWGRAARKTLQVAERTSARLPHCTIVVSKVLKEYYEARYGSKVAYIPNGVDIPPQSAPRLIIQDYGLTGRDYIFFASRLVPEKGAHYLLDAYARLDTNIKLIIAGEGLHSEDYVASLQERAGPGVIFTGYVSGELLSELFSNAYLYVLPSELEGLSLSLLEAMSYGLCVLTSDIPENREVIQDNGFTFKCRNPTSLAEMLDLLVHDEKLVTEYAARGRRRVEAEYGWDHITDLTDEVYRSLLN